MNINGNPDIGKLGKGRPKGSKNKKTLLKDMLMDIMRGYSNKEIHEKLKRYAEKNVKQFFEVYKICAKWELDELEQGKLFGPDDYDNEQDIITKAEAEAEARMN